MPGARVRWWVGILAALVGPAAAWALTDDVFNGFRFEFAIPGGRAAGLGGAFVAAASDATAAMANPAALHYVDRSEVFLDYRIDRVEGRSESGSTGSTSLTSTEPYTDLSVVTDPEDAMSLSFAGFVHPFRIGRRPVSLAFSRMVQFDTESTSDTSADLSLLTFPIVVNPATSPPSVERYSVTNTTDGTLDARFVQYDVSFEFSVSADFSVGLTVGLAELSMQSMALSDTRDPRASLLSSHPRVDLGAGAPSIVTRTAIDDTSTAYAFSVGLHWHPDTVFPSGVSPVRFGLVYRHGAEFSLTQTRTSFNPASGTFEPGVTDPLASFDNVLKVPNRWAVGVSYAAGRHWLFTADLERVQYSDLVQNLRTGASFFTSDRIPEALLPGRSALQFTVDDATVPHAGVELNLGSRGRWPSSVRGGYFLSPDHDIRLKEIDSGDPATDRAYLDLFSGGEDVDHYTVGFSLGTPVGLRFDIAGDLSKAGDRLVASGSYRFGKVRR